MTLDANQVEASTQAAGWTGEIRRTTVGRGMWQYQLHLVAPDRPIGPLGVVIEQRFESPQVPNWMVPGMFYGNNRAQESARIHPRFDPNPPAQADRFTSSYWAFRGDRLPIAAAFAWRGDEGGSVALATTAEGWWGLAGVSFGFDVKAAEAWVGLNFPYVEAPIAYTTNVRQPALEKAWFACIAGQTRLGSTQGEDLGAFACVVHWPLALYDEIFGRPGHR